MKQTVGDLRTLVTRRVGLGKRVVLLAADPGLVSALEANQCTVLVDPESHDAIASFRPQVVVAFDGLLREGPVGLESLRPVIGEAEVVLSFANAASASSTVHALTGGPTLPAWSEDSVRGWLRGAGYVIASKDVVVAGRQDTPLSADTEAALRQVLEQLNPDAAVDRYLVVAKRGVEASPPQRVAKLTSVIVAGGTDVAALEGTVRSVAGQLHKPLELVVISPLFETQLEEVTKVAKGRAGLTVVLMPGEEGEPLTLTNRALQRATGQYVCLLEAGELLDRSHVNALVKALEQTTAAWAVARANVYGARFDLKAWLEAGDVQRGRYVVDRERVGRFALQFAEGVANAEAMLFTRLAALFTPALVGTLSTLDTPRVVSASPVALLELMKARPLRALTEVSESLKDLPPVDLVAEVEARVTKRSALGGELFSRARALSERVLDAAEKAREAAKAELDARKLK